MSNSQRYPKSVSYSQRYLESVSDSQRYLESVSDSQRYLKSVSEHDERDFLVFQLDIDYFLLWIKEIIRKQHFPRYKKENIFLNVTIY